MNLRNATNNDHDAIHALYMDAFPEEENSLVATLACDLLKNASEPATLSFVADDNHHLVGHIAYSPVVIENAENTLGYILAPLGVTPSSQKIGVGQKLINHGLSELRHKSVHIVFVYGDPAYYGRFGFKEEIARNYTAPYPLAFPFGWQALVLNELPNPELSGAVRCVTSLDNELLW